MALALANTQGPDNGRPEQEHEQKRRDQGAAGAERDVTKDIEGAESARKLGQPIEHGLPPNGSFRAKVPRRESGIRARCPVLPLIRREKPEKTVRSGLSGLARRLEMALQSLHQRGPEAGERGSDDDHVASPDPLGEERRKLL